MSIEELTAKIREESKNRTSKERFELLVEAKILTRQGNYNSRFFSKETVAKSKRK
ncbi:hypothetical protein ABIC12_002731 [Pantoea agglomerans]|jgi:hypothetical protein|uniref:hypothetical protein n=1 Tax=Enterobacter agglomerans TaxID=549 RepID=UPI003396E351